MKNNAPVFQAGGTIAPSAFVKLSTAADNKVLQASTGEKICGISQEGMKRTPGLAGSDVAVAAAAGDSISVFTMGDVCLLTLGTGGCTRGDYLKSDSSGFGVTAGSTDECGAQALQSGGAGAKVYVQIINRPFA